MRQLGKSSEDEMVLAFIKAEVSSPTYRALYTNGLMQLGISQAVLIDNADLRNEQHNRFRISLLAAVRGYRKNAYLFQSFPLDVQWERVQIDNKDFHLLTYANHSNWTQLSRGTRKVTDGANNIDSAPVPSMTQSVKAIVNDLKSGITYPELIAVKGQSNHLILVEGHTRATAYVLANHSNPIEIILGNSPNMHTWFYC
jgi:hypothetical protein